MPPHLLLRGITFFLLIGSFTLLEAQSTLSLLALGTSDSIAVTVYAGDPEEGVPVLRADWTGMEGNTPGFRLDRLKNFGTGHAIALSELIVAGVEQYLDQRIHFTRNGVRTDIPVAGLIQGIDKMIALSASYVGAPAVGLSEATQKQLARVSGIDWSQASFGVDGGEDQEKYLAISFYVRAQRQELERQLRNDLIPLSGIRPLLAQEGSIGTVDRSEQVPTVCSTVFDDDNFLCALDLRVDSDAAMPDVRLTDAMLTDIASKAETFRSTEPEPKLRKRDRWLKAELDAINRRIDQSDQREELWVLRDRMDDMEGRLDDIGMQVDELNRERTLPGTTENPVANLSALVGRNVTVHFARGSSELGATEKALLNEVVRAMGLAPEGRVLVTGYADRSGSPALNLALSERRAKAVRNYLLLHGIGGERVLLNYFGASQSSGTDPAERRVELEWVR